MASDDSLGFRSFHIFGTEGSTLLAAQVTEENIDSLAKVVRGEVVNRRLFFIRLRAQDAWPDIAEVGDYVVADMAGLYVPIDKEIFEAQYRAL